MAVFAKYGAVPVLFPWLAYTDYQAMTVKLAASA